MARLEFAIAGRMVQGGVTLRTQTDDNNQPKKNDKGEEVKQCFIALAVAKNDPAIQEYYAKLVAHAKACFPHLIGADGSITHPRFAWKLQDGDGIDKNGQSVAGKPGFAGHYVIKMASAFAPQCYLAGKYGPHDQLVKPEETIQLGDYIRVIGFIDGNGVGMGGKPATGSAVPGMFVTPQLVEFLSSGERISTGINAAEAFAKLGAAGLPVGAQPVSQTQANSLPALGGGGSMPSLPGTSNPALPAATSTSLPPLGGGTGAPVGLPPLTPAAPTYSVSPAALASNPALTVDGLLAQGWTAEKLLEAGYIVKN